MGAFKFNGTNSRFAVTHGADLNEPVAFTVAAWAYRSGAGGPDMRIVAKGPTNTVATFTLGERPTQRMRMRVRQLGNARANETSDNVIASAEWRPYFGMYQLLGDAEPGVRVWANTVVNGTAVQDSLLLGTSTAALDFNTSPLTIGAQDDGGGAWNGYIAHVAIWNRVLSTGEQVDYANGIMPTGARFYWSLATNDDTQTNGGTVAGYAAVNIGAVWDTAQTPPVDYAPPPTPGTVLTVDEFDTYGADALLPAPWTIGPNAIWRVYNDGSYHVAYENSGFGLPCVATRAVPNNLPDVSIDAPYKTSTIAAGSIGGIIARANGHTSYVGWELVKTENGTSPTGVAESKAVLYTRLNGVDAEVVSVPISLGYETVYALRLSVVGNVARGYVDGVLLATYTLSPAELSPLGVAVGMVNFRGAANYLSHTVTYGDTYAATPAAWSELVGGIEQPLTLVGVSEGGVTVPATLDTIT